MESTVTTIRLKNLRKQKKVSQTEVAKFLGIERTTYTAYESGKSRPVRCLDRLAQYFNTSVDYILGLTDSPIPKEIKFQNLSETEKEIMLNYWTLNEVGKQKAKDYINDLIGNPTYTEKESTVAG